MILTLTLAVGLLAAPEPRAETPNGWTVNVNPVEEVLAAPELQRLLGGELLGVNVNPMVELDHVPFHNQTQIIVVVRLNHLDFWCRHRLRPVELLAVPELQAEPPE